jgi:CheY-like chemotaxis protein
MPTFAAASSHRAVTILMVDDNQMDVRLLQEALLPEGVRFWFAPDGLSAMRLLQGPGARPDLILLDLNMPRMDGRALLGGLKAHPELRSIPVIVMTSSNDPEDVRSTYRLHANCYIQKPLDFVRLREVVHSMMEFWGETVILPEES